MNMSENRIFWTVVITVAVTGTLAYVLYLQSEKKRLQDENDYFKRLQSATPDGNIFNLTIVPESIKPQFEISINNTEKLIGDNSFKACMDRAIYLKDFIENKRGYELFYKDGVPIRREKDLHLLYNLIWFETDFDINNEPYNGQGKSDFTASKGKIDKTIVEFKLASNPHLNKNLKNQLDKYLADNSTKNGFFMVIAFNKRELERAETAIQGLSSDKKERVLIINADKTSKIAPSQT